MAKPKSVTCAMCSKKISEEDIENKKIVKRGSIAFHPECFEQYKASNEPTIKVRLRTCPKCKEKVDPLNDDAVDVSNTTFHRECYEANKRAEKNRNDLLDYISLKYDMEFATGFMLKQISEFHNKRGYSYKAMKATLVYMFEVEKIPIKEGTGLGLIPHFYDKAKKYYQRINLAGDAAKNIEIDNTVKKIKTHKPKNVNRVRHFDLSDM